jgi:hypothetical protein
VHRPGRRALVGEQIRTVQPARTVPGRSPLV